MIENDRRAVVDGRVLEMLAEIATSSSDGSVPAGDLVQKIEVVLGVSGAEARTVIWRLADADEIRFVQGRRVKMSSEAKNHAVQHT